MIPTVTKFSLFKSYVKFYDSMCFLQNCDHQWVPHLEGFMKDLPITMILHFFTNFQFIHRRKFHHLCYLLKTPPLPSLKLSYLAETPFACKEKTRCLLGYMLSIEGDDESRPFYSICFLLPMLCQITMEKEGCMLLASFEGHKTIVEGLLKMIGEDGAMVENNGTIFLACETILNLLLKMKEMKELRVQLEEYQVVHLLRALALWTEKSNDSTTVMMASCICVLIFDLTSEEYLLSRSNFNHRTLESLSQLIARSFRQEEMSYVVGEHLDLHEIITTGYNRWADRFPLVRSAVEHALGV